MRKYKAIIGRPFEFVREDIDEHSLKGFVLDYEKDWTLIQKITDQFTLDGFALFRNTDVSAWRPADAATSLLGRIIRLDGVRPAARPNIDVGSISKALETAGKPFPLLALHREAINADVCYVGKYEGASARLVRILEISPDAKWEKVSQFRLADITQVEFGGAYENALWRVARKPPKARGRAA